MKAIIFLCALTLSGCAIGRSGHRVPNEVMAFDATNITLDRHSSKFEIELRNFGGCPGVLKCTGENRKVSGSHEYYIVSLPNSSYERLLKDFSYADVAIDQDGNAVKFEVSRLGGALIKTFYLSQTYLEKFLHKHGTKFGAIQLRSGSFPHYINDVIPSASIAGYISKVKSFCSGKPPVVSCTIWGESGEEIKKAVNGRWKSEIVDGREQIDVDNTVYSSLDTFRKVTYKE
jgi:hypothetical protein